MDQTNLDIYGNPPIPWSRASNNSMLSTRWRVTSSWRPSGPTDGPTRGDRPIVGRWEVLLRKRPRDAKESEPRREGRQRASLSRLPGLDLAFEGTATRVTDEPTLQRLAALYVAQGWPVTVKDGAFTAPYSAPSAGPPPWDLYEFTLTTAFGVASAEPHGATRWRF